MAIQHVAIADPDIHEPKGVAAATAGKVYVSDGAASGAWTSTFALQPEVITLFVEDLAINPSEHFVVLPFPVTLNSAQSVLYDAITTADAVLTFSIGATPVTGGVITITQSGSAQGDVDSCTFTAANALAAGTPLKLVVTGGAGGTGGGGHGAGGISVAANVTIKYTRTA